VGIEFYGEILGLEALPRPDFGFPGAWFAAGDVAIHLTTGGALRGAESPLNPGEAHLAFQCSDSDAMLEQLGAHGVKTWELPNSPSARRQIFFNDPWGNLIEMIVY
jgi:catechol 2,3-dioxygenase-like lactoylglutathione lyase family enzyme